MGDIVQYEKMTNISNSLHKLLYDFDVYGLQYTKIDENHVDIPYIMYNGTRYWILKDIDINDINKGKVDLMLFIGAMLKSNMYLESRLENVKYFESIAHDILSKRDLNKKDK